MATKKKPAGRDPTTIEAEQEHLLPTTSISYGSQRTEDYTANKEFHLRLPSRMANYLDAEISTRWADLVLIVCFFMAGLIDAGAYNAYQCFTSMQTGNTVFMALGVSNLPLSQPRFAWTRSLCSTVGFLLGALCTSSFHRTFGARKRWVLATAFGVQTALILGAGFLVRSGRSSESPVKPPSALDYFPKDPGFPWIDLIPISLLSFQAAGKIVASRVLQYNALPTVVLTTIYNDLMADPSLLSAGLFDNVVRNRRLAAIVLYFGSAVSGGAFARSPAGFAGTLFTAAAIKFVIVLAWLLWREDTIKAQDES